MARADLTRILRIFYSTGLRYLPVAGDSDAGAESIVGFIPRVRLDREMADLSRAGRDLDELPPELILDSELPGDLISSLSGADSVPVLDRSGHQITEWNSADALRALAIYRESVGAPSEPAEPSSPSSPGGVGDAGSTSGAPIADVPADGGAQDGAAWLARLILSEFSFPLFVSDLEGRTLFYNQAFEARVLEHPVLKKSIRLAEEFLLEVQRTLLARSIQESGEEGRVLRTRIAELETSVDIVSLSAEDKLVGYLYIFRAPAREALYEEVARMLEGKLSYDEIVDDVESNIILSMLERYEQNVSHTAKALKLRRTTLQNKIKRLKLDTRRSVSGPIPRHRRTKDELEAEKIQSLLAEAEIASAAKSDVPEPDARGGRMSDLIGEIARDVAAKRGAKSPEGKDKPASGVKKTATKKASAVRKTPSVRKAPAARKAPATKKKRIAKKLSGSAKKTAVRKSAGASKITKKAGKSAGKTRSKASAAKKATTVKKSPAAKRAPAAKKTAPKRTAKKKKTR